MNSKETREEKTSCDMVGSVNRRDCPRPKAHAAAQLSGLEDGRQDASAIRLRADLDGENGVQR